jgi:hypothetical protein
MPADNVLSVIRRYSGYVNTAGAEPPRGIQVVPMMGGGVYTQTDQSASQSDDILSGRISLGMLAAFILGAVAFYIYTKDIQGGG